MVTVVEKDKAKDKYDNKFSHDVTKIVYDLQQRKSNVVISGLPEPPADVADPSLAEVDTFTRLCEEHLSVIKPAVARLYCKRLGQPSDNRPRKLLVRLHSQTTAQSLLKAARKLRISDDSTVAANVFINPDLSPAEAKIAFQKRLQKRDRQRGSGAVAVNKIRLMAFTILRSVYFQPFIHSLIHFFITANVKTHLLLQIM